MSKEKFLQTYGPDIHREKDIEETGGGLYTTMASPLLSHEHMEKIIKKEPRNLSRIIQENPNVPSHLIDRFLNDDRYRSRGIWGKIQTVIRNENTTPETLKKLIPHVVFSSDFSELIRHRNFNEDVMDHVVNSNMENLPRRIDQNLNHKNVNSLTDHHIKTLLDHPETDTKSIATSLVASKYAKDSIYGDAKIPEHIMDHMVNHKNPKVNYAATSFRSSLLPHHIDKLLKSDDHEIRYHALRSKNVTKDHFQRALNDSHEQVKDLAQRKLKEFE